MKGEQRGGECGREVRRRSNRDCGNFGVNVNSISARADARVWVCMVEKGECKIETLDDYGKKDCRINCPAALAVLINRLAISIN